MWLHVSPNLIPDRGSVDPPGDSRIPRTPTASHDERMGWYSPWRVSVLMFDEGMPLLDYLSGFAFFQAATSYVYEVQPNGDVERDPAGGAHDSFWRCASAMVVRCLHGPKLGA